MKWTEEVVEDERTVAVENHSYRLAYWLMSYGLIGSIIYRSFVLEQQSWDLLGLVVLGVLTTALFRGARGALPRAWMIMSALAVAVALIIAFVLLRTSTVG